MAWYGFLLTREAPRPARINGLDYWTRVQGRDHWRLETAGRDTQGNWAPWARRLLGAVAADADWLEFADHRAGVYRVARLDNQGRLAGWLMIAPEPDSLPERIWLGSLFARLDPGKP